ncbi:GNAT family N-acetyltransferase [Synechococcus sp. 1G10]|uniref:GNAT family N-acetyltransferase n=1 Tax=Synechococcus sp. 1G10 TaxID=2025605 RepID=UPI000B998329|nr:GNAT family N-acetyltransferase [Synechococcus sp. 1G10]
MRLIRHRPGALGLQLGLGPGSTTLGALRKLKRLLDEDSFWAQGRSHQQLRKMLSNSEAVVTAWKRQPGELGRAKELVGFGRATSDGLFRAVLWDVVVASSHRGQGIGRVVVNALLETPALIKVERVYLMTTRGQRFYRQLGFRDVGSQHLLMLDQDRKN